MNPCPLPVAIACRHAGLTDEAMPEGKQWNTRRRAHIWRNLPPSARLMLMAYSPSHPHRDGWWVLILRVEERFGVRFISYRNSIRPLIEAGWVTRVAQGCDITLTNNGRVARDTLLRALRQRAA